MVGPVHERVPPPPIHTHKHSHTGARTASRKQGPYYIGSLACSGLSVLLYRAESSVPDCPLRGTVLPSITVRTGGGVDHPGEFNLFLGAWLFSRPGKVVTGRSPLQVQHKHAACNLGRAACKQRLHTTRRRLALQHFQRGGRRIVLGPTRKTVSLPKLHPGLAQNNSRCLHQQRRVVPRTTIPAWFSSARGERGNAVRVE